MERTGAEERQPASPAARQAGVRTLRGPPTPPHPCNYFLLPLPHHFNECHSERAASKAGVCPHASSVFRHPLFLFIHCCGSHPFWALGFSCPTPPRFSRPHQTPLLVSSSPHAAAPCAADRMSKCCDYSGALCILSDASTSVYPSVNRFCTPALSQLCILQKGWFVCA